MSIWDKLTILLQCDPQHCTKRNCSLWYEEEDLCTYKQILLAIDTTIRAKFQHRNKNDDEENMFVVGVINEEPEQESNKEN